MCRRQSADLRFAILRLHPHAIIEHGGTALEEHAIGNRRHAMWCPSRYMYTHPRRHRQSDEGTILVVIDPRRPREEIERFDLLAVVLQPPGFPRVHEQDFPEILRCLRNQQLDAPLAGAETTGRNEVNRRSAHRWLR